MIIQDEGSHTCTKLIFRNEGMYIFKERGAGGKGSSNIPCVYIIVSMYI